MQTQSIKQNVRWTEDWSCVLCAVKTSVSGFLSLAGAGFVCPHLCTGLFPGFDLQREHPRSADAQVRSPGIGEWFHHTMVVAAKGEYNTQLFKKKKKTFFCSV